jgi:PAS domain S-box-containing protein
MATSARPEHRQWADYLGIGVAAVDASGRQVYVNARFAEMLGWPASELVGAEPPYVYWPKADVEHISAAFAATMRGEAPPEGFELRFQRRDGSPIDVLVTVREALDEAEPLWVASVTDISRQRAEREQHRQQEQRLSLALEAGRLGTWDWDMVEGSVHWSPLLERIHGLEEGEFDGSFEAYQADLHPEDRARVLDTINRTAAGDEPHHLEYRIVRPDGSTRWLGAWGELVCDEEGRPVRMVGVCSDVTERIEAERALREAVEAGERTRRELREILEGLGEPFVVYTEDWRFRYVNGPAAAAMALAGHEDVLGRTLWELFPDLAESSLGDALRGAAAAREPVVFEEYREATSRWAEVHVFPMPHGGVAATWKPITERKRAEERLHYLAETGRILGTSLDWEQTLAEVTRAVVPHLADWCSVSILGEYGELRQVSVAHVDPERVRLAEELNRRYPPRLEGDVGVARVLRTGEPELIAEVTDAMIVDLARDDEHLRIIRELGLRSAILVPLKVGGRTFGVLTLISAEQGRRYEEADVELAAEIGTRAALAVQHARLYRQSELARAQLKEQTVEMELQADELRAARQAAEEAAETKAGFLATMSHELRTPLSAIISYTELLRMGVPEPLPAAAALKVERIERASQHLLAVIDEILSLSRLEAGRERVEPQATNLAELADEIVAVIEPLAAAKDLEFRPVLPPRLGTVVTDARKLRQILINLLGNAVKFTDAGGIEFAVEPSNGRLRIRVADTGVGIPPEDLERVFEPFHQLRQGRTHEVQGSGLGLAVSRRLARLIGGDIELRSEVGRGSEFIVDLPVGPPDESEAGRDRERRTRR